MTPNTCMSQNFFLNSAGSYIPKECHIMSASSGTCSLFLLNSIKAVSRELPKRSSATQFKTLLFSSTKFPSVEPKAPL